MKYVIWWAAAMLLVSLTVRVNADTQPASGDSAYEALASSYFDWTFRENPSNASGAGIHDYDAKLDDQSAAHFAAEFKTDHDYLARLDAIDPKSLSAEVQIDRQMLIYALKDDLLVTGAQWQHNPDLYTQVASGAIYAIMARTYAPLQTRIRFAIAREQQIPRLLSQGRKNTTTVDAATAQASYEDTAGSVSFFKEDVVLAFAPVKDSALQREFRKANASAMRALGDYARWIKSGPMAHPSGTFAIGKDAYQQRLLYIDGVTIPVEDYIAIGEDAIAKTHDQFVAVAHQIDPNHSPREVYETLSVKHPPANGLLSAAQKDISDLREFVTSHHVISLPADADITVVATPSFARSQTFAAFDAPGPLEKVATQTYYWVTPPDANLPRQQQEQLLGFLNDYSRPLVSAHEIMPGHFVNYAIDKHLTMSLTRQLLGSPEFAEGWAHYDEQMVVDEGWGNGDPRVRLAQLQMALVREGRYLVGAQLHTQGMTLDQAAAFLVKTAFMEEPNARREALRGTQDPMYGYYTLGKMMILKLRSDYQKKMGSQYTLQGFHDALLAHGDPPLPLLRPLLLGAQDDGKAL